MRTRIGRPAAVVVLVAIGLVVAPPADAVDVLTVTTTPPSAQPSGDGRFVLYATRNQFFSPITLLRRDQVTGTEVTVSLLPTGTSVTPADVYRISPDGRFAAFAAASATSSGVYLRDVAGGTTVPVSVRTDGSVAPAVPSEVGPGGRFVLFTSTDPGLVPGDGGTSPDVFLRDVVAGTTTRISVLDNGIGWPAVGAEARISADGRFVVFDASLTSWNPLLTGVGVFRRDLTTGTTQLVSVGPTLDGTFGRGFTRDISDDGRFVLFGTNSAAVPEDVNGLTDLFVRDVANGTTALATVNAAGGQGGLDPNLRQSFDISDGRLTGDGRYVAFSAPTAMVTGDTNRARDVFIRDLALRTTTRLSVRPDGTQFTPTQGGDSGQPELTADGRSVAFTATQTTPTTTTLFGWLNSFQPESPPSAPTLTSGTVTDGAVTLSWSPPVSTGGLPVTSYTLTLQPGGASCSSTTTTCTVAGLTNGTAYQATVVAASAAGPGPASAPASVMPRPVVAAVLSQDPAIAALLDALAQNVPVLASLRPDASGRITVPWCPGSPVPAPATPADAQLLVLGQAYTATDGTTAGPLLCRPDVATGTG